MKKGWLNRNNILYIIEAALEYFIVDLVGGRYLVNLGQAINLSTNLIHIISSFISISCVFQLFALFNKKSNKKHLVLIIETLFLTIFSSLYFFPILRIDSTAKVILFTIFVFLGYAIYQGINSTKIQWQMSYVRNDKRGVFTAIKEIVSLLSGIVILYTYSFLLDYFEANNNMAFGFAMIGIMLFVITIGHFLSELLVKDNKESLSRDEKTVQEKHNKVQVLSNLKEALSNKVFLLILITPIIYKTCSVVMNSLLANYETMIGLSTNMSVTYSVIGSLSRALVSIPLGLIGDKKSYNKAISISLIFFVCSYIVVSFVDGPDKLNLVLLYKILTAIGMAGINGALFNLLFDVVKEHQRSYCLALQNAITGLIAFLVNLAIQPLYNIMLDSNLGFYKYPEQIFAIIAASLLVGAFIYNFILSKTVIKNHHQNDLKPENNK